MKTLVNVARYHLLRPPRLFRNALGPPGVRVRRQFGNRRCGPEEALTRTYPWAVLPAFTS